MPRTFDATEYSAEEKAHYVKQLCEAIEDNVAGVTGLCKDLKSQDARFPSRRTIYNWLKDDAVLRELFDKAKEAQAELLIDQVAEIINQLDHERLEVKDVTRIKAKFDVLRWLLGKLQPYKYGDNTDMKIAELERKLEAAINAKK